MIYRRYQASFADTNLHFVADFPHIEIYESGNLFRYFAFATVDDDW